MSNDIRRQLVSAKFSLEHFLSSFDHCGQVSDYLARLVSTGRPDPGVFYGLFSTVLNEVLEAAYRHNAGVGDMNIKLSGSGGDITIDLQIPVNDAARSFYAEAVRAARERAAEAYAAELAALCDREPHPAVGLLGLAADYASTIDMAEARGSGELALSVRVSLPGAGAEELSP